MSEPTAPLTATVLPAGSVRVWWATRRPLADLDLAPLSREERARVDRLGTEPARERSALARVLVRAALADLLGGPRQAFQLDWSRGPALADASGIDLSLSHSGDRVVVALSTGGAIGVDIETAERGERLRPTVVERITTSGERALLDALISPARERAAIQLWTTKEAILKSTRDGLTIAPHTVEVAGFPEAAQLTSHASRPQLVGATQLAALRFDADYVGSLALLAAAPTLVVDERDAGDLLG